MKNISLLIYTGIMVCCIFSTLSIAAETDNAVGECLREAENAFMEANKLSTTDVSAAMEQYNKSILHFQKLIDYYNIRNSHLYYNIGNAYIMKGDIGRAILNYRAAEKLDSSDADISGNLAYARSLRIDQIPVPVEKKVLETLFFWHYDFSLKGRLFAAVVFWWLTCIIAVVMIKTKRCPTPAIAVAVLMVLCTMCLGSSVAYEAMSTEHTAFGVIIADQTIARQGDSETYPESYSEPLHSGTEFKLLEKRQGWYKIELGNADTTWVKANDVDLI